MGSVSGRRNQRRKKVTRGEWVPGKKGEPQDVLVGRVVRRIQATKERVTVVDLKLARAKNQRPLEGEQD